MRIILSFTCTAILLVACVKNNPDPCWIQINAIELEANPTYGGAEGILNHRFNNAWVYVNDQLIGAFELPITLPVLVEGEANIKVYPAVLNNGISATKASYPFVEFHEVNVTLVKNQTVTVDPVTRYKKSLTFWIEDFEGASDYIEDDPVSMTQLQHSSDASVLDPEINGNEFGRISLNDVDSNYIGYTIDGNGDFDFPKGADVYLEIDYHNTNAIVTGVLGITTSGVDENPNIQLNPQDPSEVEWKKIYIDLREIISNSPNAQYFKLSFESWLDAEDSSGEINIDNIKVIHF